ncbi:hypothetical protein Ahy_B01g056867 isoform A [Arachis hypogaea]|uniref:Transposase MuDR plant domain-containing protein n=1 Tax=Arachis hypogaea TaxID=3818 RepID=A0A445AZQ4_ARAHY|nr:hypothetical protein Ahy_B01g056867 isoform A [Arachis hypogaea]
MASEYIYVVIYPNDEISYTAEGVTFMCDDPLWIMISPQSCLQQLKNMILMNTGLIRKKEISTLIYRMPVAVASSFTYQKMHIKSDQYVSMMFSYHRSIGSIYSMELCVKLQDVGGSPSSSNNVEEMRNSSAAFVAPTQNTEIPDRRPFPNVHVAYPEGMADGLANSSEEDEIENDSGEEAEVVPETQPVQGERVIPSVVEPINVARVGALSSGTPNHYLHLSLGPMNSTNAEDIPSNYGLTGEMELEVGLKFLTKDAAMLAVKNYNIRRSVEFKVVESNHTRYVCRCKLFGDQCSWMVRVAKTRASRFWEVRKYQGPHTCLASATSQDHAQLDSNVICQHIFPMVQADATICIKVLQGSVESAYGYKVSYKKVWLAKQKAIARIYGDWDDSYNQLQRYFNALQTFVPGTIVDLQTRPYYVGNTLDRESVIFHQVFWSFPSCVEAFKHCKPLVSVDGTHLYGKYTGTLLMGIAQDGNNNILPIAFVLVERENTYAWYFFLTNLRRHVATQPDVLLISDRHAAIKAALEREGCGWEHNVYCVRHIASNFATNFKSKEAKRHLVSAAYSKT